MLAKFRNRSEDQCKATGELKLNDSPGHVYYSITQLYTLIQPLSHNLKTAYAEKTMQVGDILKMTVIFFQLSSLQC